MSSETVDGDLASAKSARSPAPATVRSRSSRGTPMMVDPTLLPPKEPTTTATWVRKVPPVIGMRERVSDASSSSPEDPNTPQESPTRSLHAVDPQSTRLRTISTNTTGEAAQSTESETYTAGAGVVASTSPNASTWVDHSAPSVRLGAITQKETRKLTEPEPLRTPTTPRKEAVANGKTDSPATTSTPDPAPERDTALPKITPSQSMPLLSTLFEQSHALLDRKEDDWAIANYDQLRHVIGQVFNSVSLIRQMLALVKRIAPIFIERHQEREATNRYKEVMYLAEKVGGEAAAEQIELNLLVADSYIWRSELALNDQELAVNIAAYANEALWLCHTYKLHDRLQDCKSKIDLAEALFCSIFLINTNIVLRLTNTLIRRPQEFSRVFKVVERTVHQLFKHQSWLMIRKLYQSGILQACTAASQKLNDDSYLLQMLFIQTQVNLTLLMPDAVGKTPVAKSTASTSTTPSTSASTTSTATTIRKVSTVPASTSPRQATVAPTAVSAGSAPPVARPGATSPALGGFSEWLPKDVPSNWSDFRAQLESLRADINVTELAQNLLRPEYVQTVQQSINGKLLTLVKSVFDYCVEMAGEPPCPFSVFALGSLSRFEAGPYSDLEYGFMIGEESKRESSYWKDLWTIFEFTFICFGERVGFHTDDQGSPKTPTFRGTPAQLMEQFRSPLNAHDISTAFSMLRPIFISSYPPKIGRDLHDVYIGQVNKMLQSVSAEGPYQHTKIGSLFLEDHLTQLPKWIPRESDPSVELKTSYLQPLVFIITDVALVNGSYMQCANAGVCQLVDLLADGKIPQLGFTAEFSRSIKTLFLAVYGLKVLAQLYYHEQFEGDKVSITPPTSTSPQNTGVGSIYLLTREQVYWLRMAQAVVLKPLYSILPHIQTYIKSDPFSSPALTQPGPHAHEPFSGIPKSWARVDPIIDSAESLVDPKFDPYNSSRSTALEDTKDLIRSLIATLIFREAPISRYRHYYKQLAADFKLLFRAAVTSHASTQGDRVQLLTYVFDSYAAHDGTRPLIERLKVHFRDHGLAMDPTLLPKLFASSASSIGPLGSSPVVVRVSQPTGWPSQSRLRPPAPNEPPYSSMKPLAVSKFEGQLGYEVIVSLVHFALIGYGAPLIDLRMTPSSGAGAKDVPALFVEQTPGESLLSVLSNEPAKFKLLDSKSFTEVVLVNIVLMCHARAEDLIFEPHPEDSRGGYRLCRTTFGSATPSPETVLINKERAQLQVCNIVFCMSSMLQTVHPYAVEEFLALSPTHLMTRLVQDIELLNKDWKGRIDASTLAAFNKLVQPSPLPGATSLINVPHYVLSVFFDRINRLHHVLTESPRATHLDLLRAVDPVVAQIYSDILTPTASSLSPPTSAVLPPGGSTPGSPSVTSASAAASVQTDRSPVVHSISGSLAYQASGNNSNAGEILDRLARVQAKKEMTLNAVFTVPSTSPELFTRIEALRRSPHALLPSSLPSTEPIFEKSDHSAHFNELKSQVMSMAAAGGTGFPREDMLKSSNLKEKLLSSIDFSKLDNKKQRQALLSLFDSVKFTSQLRIRHCSELDHQRLSKILSGDTLKQLTILDLRGMTGLKPPTLALIASLENLEYLNLSQTDIKSVCIEKWTKRETLSLDRVIWISFARCTGLQHINLRAPNLRHLDISGTGSVTEFKIWSSFKIALIGSLPPSSSPYYRVFAGIPSASWFYTTDCIPPALEKMMYDASSGRDHRLLLHLPLGEAAFRIVIEIVKHSPTLEIVDLSNSYINSDELIEAVLAAAVYNPSIKSIDLTMCGVKPNKTTQYTQQAAARSDLKLKF